MKGRACDTAGAENSIFISTFAARLQRRIALSAQGYSSQHLADMVDVIVPPLLVPCHLLVARHGSHVEITAQSRGQIRLPLPPCSATFFKSKTVIPRDASILLTGVLALTKPG